MSAPPETRYAKNGDLHIAYQVVGESPLDLVFVPGWVSHVELAWEMPELAYFLSRLASFSRLILIDKRGTGLSDPLPLDRVPTLEERMDDVRAVMDSVGSQRAAFLGVSEGGAMNLMFAATHPDRTSALVLYNTFARVCIAPDYPFGLRQEIGEAFLRRIQQEWGSGVALDVLAPTRLGDPRMQRWWARYQRLAASPGAAAALLRAAFETDARSLLPTISVPTLVVHREGDRMLPVEHGRYLARHIPGARYVEVPGSEHLFFIGEVDPVLNEIQEFLTGVRPAPDAERVLATVLLTDIVGSTERAADMGDARWKHLLDGYYALVRRELERFQGRQVSTAGDGVLATFDGPARAVRCALGVRSAVRELGVDVRCGLHAGECEIGEEEVGGIAVHIAARVTDQAGPGEVLVSSTVKDLVAGSGIRFEDRGAHRLKGIADPWRLFAVA